MRGRRKKPTAPTQPPVIDMAKVIAAANRTAPVLNSPVAMALVEAAAKRLDARQQVPAPAPRSSTAGLPPEDAARRGYLKRTYMVRACCGFYHSDFDHDS